MHQIECLPVLFLQRTTTNMGSSASASSSSQKVPLRICYASLSNTTKQFALRLQEAVQAHKPTFSVSLINLCEADIDDLITAQTSLSVNLFLMPSYNVETPLDSVMHQISDASHDFRVGSAAMHQVRYAVLGVGHKEWQANGEYCIMAKKLDGLLSDLGARRIFKMGIVDTAEDPESDYANWQAGLLALFDRSDLATLEAVEQSASSDSEKSDTLFTPSDASSASESEAEGSVSQPKTVAQRKALAAKRKAVRRLRGQPAIASDDIEDIGRTLESVKLAAELEKKKQEYALIGSHSIQGSRHVDGLKRRCVEEECAINMRSMGSCRIDACM